MKIIDLSITISNDLPVFAGDPSVEIEQLQTFTEDAWNMKRFHINGHDGTRECSNSWSVKRKEFR